jgi:hypothetical protein
MRKEVANLIDVAVQICLDQLKPNTSEVDSVAEENTQFLERRSFYWQQLFTYFENNKEIKDIYAGAAGTIVVEWGSNPQHNNIVIEICLYAPLVAVYKYGVIPTSISDYVDDGIKKCNLTSLSEEEIATLEENYTYHLIF